MEIIGNARQITVTNLRTANMSTLITKLVTKY